MKGRWRTKRISVLLALCAFVEAGCNEAEEAAEMMDKKMIYMKDYRSGICFASITQRKYTSLTAVPCTPAVEALIINKREKLCEKQCSKNASPLQPEKIEQK